ncbi:MAG: ABC transporter permease [Pseudomonadota bacterium]
MLWLAFKTLFHEKGRLIITLIGITISTVLALIEVAIYLGMMGNATAVIRHTDADIWIGSKNIQSFDFALPFPEHRINQVRAFSDVQWADKIILTFAFVKLADGRREQVQVIAYNPDTGVGAPWAMLEGRAEDVKGGHYMILDKTSEQRLGRLELGSQWELTFVKEHSFKLVGLSQGIKSFTTIPVMFMSYNQFQPLLADMALANHTAYIVAKLKDPAQAQAVAQALRVALRDNDVFTRDEFVYQTVMYWTVQTGMGMAFFLTAILAVLIGGAIVGQAIFAFTMEHLREYGTLKALGARNSDLYLVIFSQTVISAVIGYALGVAIIFLVRDGIEQAGVDLYVSPILLVVLFFTLLLVCLAAAYVSVRKVRMLDPVTVFKA